MLAAIRLAVTCPGAIPPKMSCVTFPMAPVGVMLASPVIRQTTSARKKEMTTAMQLIQYGTSKVTWAR